MEKNLIFYHLYQDVYTSLFHCLNTLFFSNSKRYDTFILISTLCLTEMRRVENVSSSFESGLNIDEFTILLKQNVFYMC